MNSLGLKASVSSTSFIVDRSPPLVGRANVTGVALPSGFALQEGFPRNITGASVSVGFTGWQDDQSGLQFLRAYLVMACSPSAVDSLSSITSPVGLSALPAASQQQDTVCIDSTQLSAYLWDGPVELATSGQYSVSFGGQASLPLLNGSVLVPFFYSQNGVGQTTFATGSPFTFRVSALSAGVVNDGYVLSANDTDALTVSSGLFAWWYGFRDTDDNALNYTVSWGLRPGSSDLYGPIKAEGAEFPNNASVIDKVTVKDGTTVYATVFCSNVLGLRVNASSDGVLYDSSAPLLTYVGIGAKSGVHSMSVTPGAKVAINWACADPHSNVSYVDVSLGTSQQDVSSIMAPVRLSGPQITSGVVLLDATAPQASSVVAKVTCVNGVGLSATQFSAMAWADNTPPVVRSMLVSSQWPLIAPVRAGTQYLSSATRLFASWDIFDVDSGLKNHSICIGTAVNKTDLLPCTPVPAEAVMVTFGGAACPAPTSSDLADPLGRNMTCVASSAAALRHGAALFVTASASNFAVQTASVVSSVVVELQTLNDTSAQIVVARRDPASGMRAVSMDTNATAAFVHRPHAIDILASAIDTLTFSMERVGESMLNGTNATVIPPVVANFSALDPAPALLGSWIYTLYAPTNVSLMAGASYQLVIVATAISGLTHTRFVSSSLI